MNYQPAKSRGTQRTAKVSPLDSSLGLLPPQAIDLEEAVLSALILEPYGEQVDTVLNLLRVEDFYKESHQIIYGAIHQMIAHNKRVDLLTLSQYLRKTGDLEIVGGQAFLAELSHRIGSIVNADEHARIIQEMSMKRRLISIGSDLLRKGYDPTIDVFQLMEEAERAFGAMNDSLVTTVDPNWGEQMDRTLDQMRYARDMDGITGVPSSFYDVNKLFSGYVPKSLYIIGARPAMGKTLYALNEALFQVMRHGKRVDFWSLEMSDIQNNQRILSLLTGIEGEKIVKGQLTPEEWALCEQKRREIEGMPFYLHDLTDVTVREITASVRSLKRRKGLDIVYVDYLQLVGEEEDPNTYQSNRNENIGKVSRGLKKLAKSQNIPVIALAQLSRAVETRGGDKRPMLADLRDSGSLEQDADAVQFLYRPYYYGIEVDAEGNSTLDRLVVIHAKNRMGALDDVFVQYLPRINSIQDYYQAPVNTGSIPF